MERTLKLLISAPALVVALGLTACGSTTGDRALSGGAIGAGVGTVGTAITGGCVSCGAAVGGVAGAAAGALSDEDDIDLGKPLWRR